MYTVADSAEATAEPDRLSELVRVPVSRPCTALATARTRTRILIAIEASDDDGSDFWVTQFFSLIHLLYLKNPHLGVNSSSDRYIGSDADFLHPATFPTHTADLSSKFSGALHKITTGEHFIGLPLPSQNGHSFTLHPCQ